MDMLNNPLNNLGPIQQAQNILRQTSPGYQVREYCENLGGRGIVEDVMEKMIPLYSLRKQEEENLRMVEESGLVTYLKDKSSPSTLEPVKSYLERYWEERERERRESLGRYLEKSERERRESLGIYFLKDYLKE